MTTTANARPLRLAGDVLDRIAAATRRQQVVALAHEALGCHVPDCRPCAALARQRRAEDVEDYRRCNETWRREAAQQHLRSLARLHLRGLVTTTVPVAVLAAALGLGSDQSTPGATRGDRQGSAGMPIAGDRHGATRPLSSAELARYREAVRKRFDAKAICPSCGRDPDCPDGTCCSRCAR